MVLTFCAHEVSYNNQLMETIVFNQKLMLNFVSAFSVFIKMTICLSLLTYRLPNTELFLISWYIGHLDVICNF